MVIDYKKLIPANLREGRWGEFIEAFQSLIDNNITPDKIDIIKMNQVYDQISDDQLQDYIYYLGKDINLLTGYTSTSDHLRKQLKTQVLRILNKTTRKAYKYTFYCYNFQGDVYPLYKDVNGIWVADDWWTTSETSDVTQYLDDGWYLDTDDGFSNLDKTAIVDDLTRHILVSYYPLLLEYEDNTTFANSYTLTNFYNDIMSIKKKTEIIYFEPQIHIELNSDKTLKTRIWNDFENGVTSNTESILIEDDLIDIDKIRFGSGGHTVVDNTITDVATFEVELDYTTELDIKIETSSEFKGRKLLTQKPQFISAVGDLFNVTEICFLNSSGDCIFYAKFPKIQLLNKMYSNIYLNIVIS